MPIQLSGGRLREAFDNYIQESLLRKRRQATIEEIQFHSDRLLKFLNGVAFSHTSSQSYLDTLSTVGIRDRKWKPSSVWAEFKLLKKFSNWLVKKQLFDEIFKSENFVLPERDDNEEVEIAELPSIILAQKIINAGTEPGRDDHILHRQRKAEMRDALNFMIRTGMRVGELRKMKGSDLHLDAEVPSYWVRHEVSKSRKSVLLPLTKAQDMLNGLRKRTSNEKLFDVNDGTLNIALKRGCQKVGWAGKQITNHSLRHIFACNCAKNGMPNVELARLMRHTSIEITNKYYLHYTLADLSASMNSHHDLMKYTLSIQDRLRAVTKAIEATGIRDDGRFLLEFHPSKKELVIKLKFNAENAEESSI